MQNIALELQLSEANKQKPEAGMKPCVTRWAFEPTVCYTVSPLSTFSSTNTFSERCPDKLQLWEEKAGQRLLSSR